MDGRKTWLQRMGALACYATVAMAAIYVFKNLWEAGTSGVGTVTTREGTPPSKVFIHIDEDDVDFHPSNNAITLKIMPNFKVYGKGQLSSNLSAHAMTASSCDGVVTVTKVLAKGAKWYAIDS